LQRHCGASGASPLPCAADRSELVFGMVWAQPAGRRDDR
jgi:hypothetical protein